MRTARVASLIVLLTIIGAYGGQSGSAPAAATLSRAEFVAMVSDYFQWVHWSEYNDYAKSVPRTFSDVNAGDRYVQQIECALEERIISPDANNRFYPAKAITRQDGAAILSLAFNLPASLIAGYLKPAAGAEPKLAAGLQRAEVTAILKKITADHVSPVQVMPKPGTTAYRRNLNFTTPTPGAKIYFTMTDDRTEPPNPTTALKPYDSADGYPILDIPNGAKVDYKYFTIKAMAVKDGLVPSAIRTFSYVIYRPQSAPFEARLVHAPTPTSPAVWDIMNQADYNRPHAYYVEGSARGVVMDAGQYPLAKGANLKTFIDGLATKPYDAVLGHNNPDHVEQIDSFVQGGVKLYMTAQDKGSVLASKRADFMHAANASILLKDGDVLDLGNVQLTAYQTPGHSNGLVILQDKKNGWIFGSDMFGCNRPATVDITNYSGVKMDLFLSLVQQLYTNLTKDGARVEEVYNAHNETPVGYAGIKNFEAAVQQLIDVGDSATVPSMRGTSPGGGPIGKQRTSVVGDMWRDKNWIALWVGGTYGGPVTYLTAANPNYKCNNTIDYAAPGGHQEIFRVEQR